ncbi:DUF2934 domain-containing protein [Dyella sp.]|uniref:DUF2934 domain-containing protein n=1 Tax=Dyella sp. TaxID=1869338 RepID=UPI002ED26F7C
MSDNPDRDERIRQLAHRIWESEGRPQGQQIRHWQMATRLVEASERAGQERQRDTQRPEDDGD